MATTVYPFHSWLDTSTDDANTTVEFGSQWAEIIVPEILAAVNDFVDHDVLEVIPY